MRPKRNDIPPPLGSGDIPSLHKLPGLKFQALCRDLLDVEVGPCAEFGVNGQAQYGIDLIAQRRDECREVAQCKAESDFPPAKIRRATKEFLDHWEYWRSKNIARFILCVGSELTHRQRQEEILKQRDVFANLGIGYEVWSSSTIVNRLRPHRGLVTTHLGAEWVKYVCGSNEESRVRLQLAGMSALTERLSLALSEATDARISQAKELWLSGKRQSAREILEKVRADVPGWLALTPAVRATALRLDASLLVDTHADPAHIQTLLAEAASYAPDPNDCLFRAALYWREGKPAKALAELATASTDRANLQSAMYLSVLGRLTEATTLLSRVKADTSERFRVETLVHLAAHRMAEARRASLKALELAPAHSLVRLSAAIVEYYSSLAEDVVPGHIPAWPDPLSWSFVRRDDASQQRLRRAAERFEDLSREAAEGSDERRCLEAWRLACLANDAEHQDKAKSELDRLLKADPRNYRLLVWATARFPGTNCTAAFNALRSAVIEDGGSAEELIALVHYYVGKHQYAKALKLLDSHRDAFIRERAETAWVGWKAQVLALLKRRAAAIETISSSAVSEVDRLSLEARIRRITGGDTSLAASFIDLYRKSHDAKYLLDGIEVLAQRGEWQAASDYCEEALQKIGTAEVAWLAVDVASRAHRPDLCLRLLDGSQHFFPAGRLPLELRRVKVHSQHRLGLVPPAVEEAARIADEEPSVRNLLDFAHLLFSIGDLRRLCSVAERLLRMPEEVAAPDLLRLAWQCQWEDRALAKRLWTRAATSEIPDDLVATALLLGYNLGADESVAGLTHRMMALASEGKGKVQLASLDQLRQYSIEFQENALHLWELYRNGQVPLHLIASPLNQTLAHFFHEYRNEAANAPLGWPVSLLFARHGRKGLPKAGGSDPLTLKADVSGLLVAYRYGFLQQVEQAFGPIRIAPQLVPSLLMMQHKLSSAQITRIEVYRQILANIADGRIKGYSPSPAAERTDIPESLRSDWLAAMEHANAEGGLLVDFLPIPAEARPIDPEELPDDVKKRLIGSHAVLRALWEHGRLTDQEFRHILDERVPSIKNEPIPAVPIPGTALFFRGTAIEVLASIGILPHLVGRFRVFIEASEIERLRAETAAHNRHVDTAKWLKELTVRISDGIQAGRYAVLENVGEQSDGAVERESAVEGEVLKGILRPAGLLNERLWVDDRCLTRFEYADTVEIIDSVDLLRHLVDRNYLSTAEYYLVLGRMRAEAIALIPVSSDEILSAVQAARVKDGELVETIALTNLRRGIAMALLQSSFLKHDAAFAGQPSGPSELGFLLQIMRAVEDAVLALHASPTESETVELQARRSWIVDSLYASPAALRRLAELPGSDVDGEYLEAIGQAGLLMRAIVMQGSAAQRKAGQQYMQWLFRRIVQPRIRQQPEFLARITLAVSQLLESAISEPADNLASTAGTIVLQRFFEDLPTDIRSELLKNTDLLGRIGIKPTGVVEVAGMRLDSREFFIAAADVVNGRRGVVHEVGGEEVVFTAQHGVDGFFFKNVATGQTGTINDAILGLLVESIAERERRATALFKDYDVPAVDRPAEVAGVITTEDFGTRIAAAEDHRNKDLRRLPAALEARLRGRQPLREADCWPESLTALSRYLRLNPQEQLDLGALERGFAALVADHPTEEALARIAALPVELPQAVEAGLAALSPEQRRSVVKHLLTRPATPLRTIQLSRVVTQCFDAEPHFQRLANARFGRLLRNDAIEVRAYLTLVRWVSAQLGLRPEATSWSESFRLGAPWLLADSLIGTFLATGVAPQWVIERFSVSSARAEHIFENKPEWQHDVAFVNNVEPEVFTLCGLAYAFENRPEALGRKLRDQITSKMLNQAGDQLFPVLAILVHAGTASNELGSFLARDRIAALYASVAPEAEEQLRVALAQTPLEQAAIAIQTLGPRGWLVLAVVLGGLPPPSALLPVIGDAMRTTDFASGVDGDLRLGVLALSVAASLAPIAAPDDSTNRLKEQLLLIVKAVGQQQSTVTDQFGALVLECALNLSRLKATVNERVLDFSTFVAQIALEYPPLADLMRPIIQRICDDLPMDFATELWRLNLRLRTAKLP